jgi:hypothetical protein
LIACVLALVGFSFFYLRSAGSSPDLPPSQPPNLSSSEPASEPPTPPSPPALEGDSSVEEPLKTTIPEIIAIDPLAKEKPYVAGSSHPILQLIKESEKSFADLKKRQSKSLKEAVAEYKRRYGIPPPPNFNKWYAFATKQNVQMIDEFDSIHDSLAPFWGLKPATIRGRAQEALGFPNSMMGIFVRGGEIKNVQGGQEWQRDATMEMMKDFQQYLPDMDLSFNIHDEPRVVVPYDDLSRLVEIAKTVNMPAANAVAKPRNSWSPRSADMSDGVSIEEFKTTRFNVFAHQPTWTHSRVSCPPSSPARSNL